MTTDRYITLAGTTEAVHREKASKFLAWAFPIEDEAAFKEVCARIAREHHSANHVCWGWVLGSSGERTRSNDDGEPAGTAGRPILRALTSAGLVHAAVVVVRYFGGTLLGKPGLVHAYGGAATLAVEAGVRIERVLLSDLVVECGYEQMGKVKRDVLQHAGRIAGSELSERCVLLVQVARSDAERLLARWRDEGMVARYAEAK